MRQQLLTRRMLHNTSRGPILAGFAVPIEGLVGQIVLVGDPLGDPLVDESHYRRDLNRGPLKTLLLPARLFQRLHVLSHFRVPTSIRDWRPPITRLSGR